MSKFTEQLSGIRVFNPYEFAGDDAYLEYFPNDNSRGGRSARWCVYRKGDAPESWRSSAVKEFVIWGAGTHAEVKAQKLEEAKAWASERYGIKEWARTPFGTWMDAEFVKRRIAELKEQLKDGLS